MRAQGVTSRAGTSRIPSAGATPPSSLLQAHAPILNPPTAYGRGLDRRVFAGCCQPLLGVGPSRRCLCESVSACLNPYPGRSCGARTRFFPQNNGLPDVMTRSALGNTRTAISVRRLFRGCGYSIIFRPADLLAPRLLLPQRLSAPGSQGFYFSAYLGPLPRRAGDILSVRYRATDGRGTCTLLDSQPCRLLP